MIIEIRRNGRIITDCVVTAKPPMYAGTILVHELVVHTNLYEGEWLSASFNKANGTAITSAMLLKKRIKDSDSEWYAQIPNAVMTEGNKTVSVAILDLLEQAAGEYPPPECGHYKVVTSADVPFTVYPSNAHTDFEPINEQLSANHERRIQVLEDTVTIKTLLDFTVDSVTGQGVKYYSDGTTANIQFPTGGSPPDIKTDWLRVIEFSESRFIASDDDSFELAFGAEQTGYTDNKYISILDRTDSKTYEAGTSETTPSLRQGYSQLAERFFKGSDGSLLLSEINTPFAGRIILLGGSVFSGKLVTSVEFVSGAPNIGAALKITYAVKDVDGEPLTETIPLTNVVTDSGYTHTDCNYTAAEKSKLRGIQAGAQVNPTLVSAFTNDRAYQTESEVAAVVAALVDSSPETLNTLNELAEALGNDPNFAKTITEQIAEKAPQTQVAEIEERDSVTNVSYDNTTYKQTITYRYAEPTQIQLPTPETAQRYTASYLAADWQDSPAGSELPYCISIPQETHKKGGMPICSFANNQWFEVANNDGNLTIYTNIKKNMAVIIL